MAAASRQPPVASRQPPAASRWAVLAALLFQLCAAGAQDIECAVPREAVAAPATGRLAVISWNVHGLPFDPSLDARLDRVAQEILRRRPDLVLLQETWITDAAERLDCRLRGEYRVVPDPDNVTAGWLGFYGHRRGGLLALVRRDSPWQLDPAVAPRFEEFRATGPWERLLEERDAVAGKGIQGFTVGDGSRRMKVLNTHLQAQYGPRTYAEVRSAQIGQVLDRAKENGADVVLVAGDFNTSPRERTLYGTLTGVLRDLTAEFRRACRCGTLAGPNRTTRHWFDYVLARAAGTAAVESSMDLIRNRAANDPYSDHHGIWLEMRISQ